MTTPSAASVASPTHYSILNIPYPPPHLLSKSDVKLAYHRALLKHHPDKSRAASSYPAKTPTTNSRLRTNASTNGSSYDKTPGPPCINDGVGIPLSTAADSPASFDTRKVIPAPPPNAPLLGYTIDQITTAYKVLSDPVARAEYDRSLRLLGINHSGHALAHGDDEGTPFRTGMEVFDLDDMEIGCSSGSGTGFDDSRGGTWYHSCRCGEEKGFLVLEEDLEREAEGGEVVVGCRGCSLWARVVFAVDEGGNDRMKNDQIS